MGQTLPLDILNSELSAVGPDLARGGEFLRGVLAGSGDCIKILDLDGRLQFMSEGGQRVMEVEDFSVLKGCPWPDFWAGSGNAQAIEAVAEAKAGRTFRFRNAANTAKGTPRYWDVQVSPIMGTDGTPSHLLSISRDITEEHNAAEAQKTFLARQKFLTDELAHRLKNTLTTVLAISNQTFRDTALAEHRQIFEARIQTLNAGYELLNESNWSASLTRRIVESALKPYRSGEGRFSISGPDYHLPPVQALALALALNELATNALKYGALSAAAGKVDIAWAVKDGVFEFAWRESGGPDVSPPTRTSFGSRLIKTMLAADFGGTVDVAYERTGVVCTLRAPVT